MAAKLWRDGRSGNSGKLVDISPLCDGIFQYQEFLRDTGSRQKSACSLATPAKGGALSKRGYVPSRLDRQPGRPKELSKPRSHARVKFSCARQCSSIHTAWQCSSTGDGYDPRRFLFFFPPPDKHVIDICRDTNIPLYVTHAAAE